MMFEQGLPSSIEAERSILGGILLDNELFFDEIADLSVRDFSFDSHQIIFSCINEILFNMEEGVTQVDMVTLAEFLRKRKQLQTIGGVSYLASLTEGLPRRLKVEPYVRIVKEKAKLRRLINIFSGGLTRAADQSEESAMIAEDVQSRLVDEAAEGDGDAVRIGDIAPEVEAGVERGRDASNERSALELTWGISGMDTFTKGAFGGELTVLSGESGGFKTTLATQMVLANAREGVACAIFSMEMPKEKIVRRFYPQMSNIITADHMRDPRLMNLHTHVPEMKRMSSELRSLPIWIDDTSPLPHSKLVARIRMMVRKYKIRLAIIDYLQLIVPSRQPRTEAEGIKSIVFGLRDLGKMEPTLHQVLLSQFSKADGFQKKRRRSRGDLYGSSAIHHAAQNVLLISVESGDKKERNDLLDVEIAIDKQRDGRLGKVSCMLDRDHLLFTYPQPPLTK